MTANLAFPAHWLDRLAGTLTLPHSTLIQFHSAVRNPYLLPGILKSPKRADSRITPMEIGKAAAEP
jgi:hypothetical protein